MYSIGGERFLRWVHTSSASLGGRMDGGLEGLGFFGLHGGGMIFSVEYWISLWRTLLVFGEDLLIWRLNHLFRGSVGLF